MSETLTKRERIVAAMLTALRGIKTAAGYRTNLGDYVFDWLTRPLTEDEMPGACVRDLDATVEDLAGLDFYRLPVAVEIYELEAAVMRAAAADVKKAIAAARFCGGAAEDMRVLNDGVEAEQNETQGRVQGQRILFEVQYVTARLADE